MIKYNKKIELLAPAGDLEKLKIAIIYGADAVFIGGKKFSLRAKASNFELQDIKEAVEFASSYGAKIYITVNVYPHNDDLEGLDEYLLALDEIGVNAIIASSMDVIMSSKRLNCKFEVHLSTQQSTANSLACKFFEELNVKRIVLAREATINQIKQIKDNSKMDLEVFIHGGMCAAFSGRCVLSNNLADRDANRGGCAHSCRWYYDLYQNEEKINQDQYCKMASKDLMGISVIKDLIDAGVDSLKIEGRMKSHHYIATVVGVYRRLIDEIYELGDSFSSSRYQKYIEEIQKCENRLSSVGFLKGDVTYEGGLFAGESERPSQDFIAYVLDFDYKTNRALIETRNYFKSNIEVESISPKSENHRFNLGKIYTIDGNTIDISNKPNEKFWIQVDFPLVAHSMIRKVND
jgi:putative protease